MSNNQAWLERIKKQINPNHSDAADYWDSLKPEWRGVVLHAASITGTAGFSAHLAQCNWAELYSRVDSRGMAQIRTGIQTARGIFQGFGSLRHSDFVRRTTCRPEKSRAPIKRGADMVIAPEILAALAHTNQSTEG